MRNLNRSQQPKRLLQRLLGRSGDRGPAAVGSLLTPALASKAVWSAVLRSKIPTRRCRDLTQEALVSQRDATTLMPPESASLAPARRIGQQCAPVSYPPGKTAQVDQIIHALAQVSSRTRERPIRCAVGEAGAHRIHQNIACRGIQMGLVHRKRGEPPLPEATGPALSPVDDRCVTSVGLADSAGEAPRGDRYRDEVNVVGKQAVGPDRNRLFLALLSQKLSVELVVERAEEGRLPPVSPLGHVVG